MDWLLPLAPSLPARLLPNVLEVFGVWQNVFADFKNPRSAAIIEVCSNWLIELEGVEYPEDFSFEHGRWDALGGEARSSLATALRMTIMRSARSYPRPRSRFFERAITNERMRSKAYSDLMGFTSTMVDVAPEAVVAVAKAELMEELPQDRFDREEREHREYAEHLKRLRAIPEKERTEEQKRALEHMYFPIGHDRIDLDDIGIDRHHNYYYPAVAHSRAVRQPLREEARGRALAWYAISPTMRPRVGIRFSSSTASAWEHRSRWSSSFRGASRNSGATGTSTTGSWAQLAPNSLECAFLALSYWAFKQIEDGRPTDEVIRAVVEGNECYAVLGLALVLALETYDVSETTLPIVTCQRLWHHDMARVVHEPTRNIDLLGFGFLSRLTGEKAKAKEFLGLAAEPQTRDS